MLTYIIIFCFIIGLGLVTFTTEFYRIDHQRAKKRYIQWICFVLVLVSGLRNLGVGDDTYAYYLTYNDIAKTSWDNLFSELLVYISSGEGKDVGFPILVKATQLISSNFQFFLLFVAVFFTSILGNFIYKNTTNLTNAIIAFTIFYVLFFYIFSMTAIRQSIAIAATLYCYELIKRKKLVSFVLIILLFSTIHKSILIFIPFYFICRLKQTKYLLIIVLVAFPIIMVFINSISFFLLNFVDYQEYEQFEGNAGAYTFTAIFLFIAIIALFKRKMILKQNPLSDNYFNAFAIAILLLPMAWIHPALLRITMYFSIFIILLIPEIIQNFQQYSFKLRRGLTVISVGILFVLFIKNNYSNDKSEYRFFWEEVKLGKNYE